MKTHHTRKAAGPLTRSVLTGRRVWLASIVLPIIAIVPAIAYVVMPQPTHHDLETVIKQAGFDPLLPPSRLRGPGALYEVENGFYRKVCDAGSQILQGRIHTSPIENQVSERLESGGFSMGGEFIEGLNAKLGGGRVTSIEFRLTDATVSEIPMSDLTEIEDNLLRQKSCDETVQRLLKANRKVCSGYAVLRATTFYKIKVASKFESDVDVRAKIMNAAQKAIEEHTQGKLQSKRADELTGENLFYGIQLSTLCLTLDTATEPSVRKD